ncbi:hypothetical protein ACTXT7_016987 [Hymenolepis weldensis]
MGATYSKCWHFRSKRNWERGDYLDRISSSEVILGETADHQKGIEHTGKSSRDQSKTTFLYDSPDHSPILVNVLQDSKLARHDSKIQDVSKSRHLLENPVRKNSKSSYETTDFSSRSSRRHLQPNVYYRIQRDLRPKSCLPIFPYNYGVRMAKEILTKAVENSKIEKIIKPEIPAVETKNTIHKGDEENSTEIQQVQAPADTTNVIQNMLERSVKKHRVRTPLGTRPRSVSTKKQTPATKIKENAKVILQNQGTTNTVKAKASNGDMPGNYIKIPSRHQSASKTRPRSESIRRQKLATKRHQAETSSQITLISSKRVRNSHAKRQLENAKINSIETPSSTTIVTPKCIVKIPRHTAYAPYKVRLFLKECEKIESVVIDPDDQRIDIICDRHMCKLDIYAKREIAGNLMYTMDIECEIMEWLKECIHDLDAVFGFDIHWQLDAALEREYYA